MACAAQRLLHRDLAALEQRRIGAGADDLAGARHEGRKIIGERRIEFDGIAFVRHVFAVVAANDPLLVGEQPDVDAEFVQHLDAAPGCSGRDQMLLDRLQLRIDDRTAVERPDRKRDAERLDQKPHADRRPAAGDGKTDAGIVQPLHRALRAIGQTLVVGHQGAVDVGDHQRDAVHDCFLSPELRPAVVACSLLTISSTIVSTGASIDTSMAFSSRPGGSRVLNWLSSSPGGMK